IIARRAFYAGAIKRAHLCVALVGAAARSSSTHRERYPMPLHTALGTLDHAWPFPQSIGAPRLPTVGYRDTSTTPLASRLRAERNDGASSSPPICAHASW